MRKIKKILSLFTAIFVAASLALSSSTAGALNEEQIKTELEKIVVNYNGADPKPLKGNYGWLNLLGSVLAYAEATDADVKPSNPPGQTDNWADFIAGPQEGKFKALVGDSGSAEERNNLEQMLNNFGHGYWQSGYRIKGDYKLFVDWGFIHFTVERREENSAKPYITTLYDNSMFLSKIREIYNLDTAANAQKYDLLCLRAILRAMVEYDKSIGIKHDTGLDSLVDIINFHSECGHNLMRLIMNDATLKEDLRTNEDFSQQNRARRQNAAEDYKVIANLLTDSYYSSQDTKKERGKDYQIVFDENGYVAKIESIRDAGGSGDGAIIKILPTSDNSGGNGSGGPSPSGSKKDPEGGGPNGGGGGGPDPRKYIIKETGSGVEHFVPAIVALTASLSGIAGLGYVVSRKKDKKR